MKKRNPLILATLLTLSNSVVIAAPAAGAKAISGVTGTSVGNSASTHASVSAGATPNTTNPGYGNSAIRSTIGQSSTNQNVNPDYGNSAIRGTPSNPISTQNPNTPANNVSNPGYGNSGIRSTSDQNLNGQPGVIHSGNNTVPSQSAQPTVMGARPTPNTTTMGQSNSGFPPGTTVAP